jgi:hypothetical protein
VESDDRDNAESRDDEEKAADSASGIRVVDSEYEGTDSGEDMRRVGGRRK